MNIQEINEEIRIEDFLRNQGFLPAKVKKQGKELWYCSPLRNENTPSFKVNTLENVWYDYAEGKGGKLLTLCIEMKHCTAKEAVLYFNTEYKGVISTPIQREEHFQKISNNKENNTEDSILREIYPVKNSKLWDYLRERKIDFDIAKKYLKEIHYLQEGKFRFALGFKCDRGGYELRSAITKRNIAGKTTTSIKNGSEKVKIFEGFFNFLSYATEHKSDYQNYDYVVLNSSAFAEKMYNDVQTNTPNDLCIHLLNYKEIDTYFDNDDTGKKITQHFKEIFNAEGDFIVNDFSILYEKYNDYNDFCMEGRIKKDFTAEEDREQVKIANRNSEEIQSVGETKEQNNEVPLSQYSFFKI